MKNEAALSKLIRNVHFLNEEDELPVGVSVEDIITDVDTDIEKTVIF